VNRLRPVLPSREEAVPALGSAALFAIAFPPFPFLFPVFLMLVPVAVRVARAADAGASARGSWRMGFWFGFLGYACNLYWIAIALSIYSNLSFLGYIASLFVMAPLAGLALLALHSARRATRWPLAILLPVTWVAYELLLNYFSDLAFPWLPLGLAVSGRPVLAQIAELSGVRGLSFWIAATSGLLADAWLLSERRRAALLRLGGALVLALLVAAFGWWRMSTIELREVAPVAIVQPNIPQEDKWQEENRDRIVEILAELTRDRIAAGDSRMIVWPEVALPGYLAANPGWADTLSALSTEGGTPILFGVLDVIWRTPTEYDYFNAALIADVDGRLDRHRPYHKSYLVPIVERVPFVNPEWFGAFRWFGGFGRGAEPPVFEMPFGRFGVLICYESVFLQRSRLYRREGADLLVNITNDAWFGTSIAPHQHLMHLPLRAIENRVGVVRSANTGISAYIDPLGRVHGATGMFTREAHTYMTHTTDVRTLYVRVGDWVGALSAAGTLLLVAFDIRRRRRR
jgi:apolipoprotein N-acyltransferase